MEWDHFQKKREQQRRSDLFRDEEEQEEGPEEFAEEQPESAAQDVKFKTAVNGWAFLSQSILGDEQAVLSDGKRIIEDKFMYEGGKIGLRCYIYGEVEVMPGEDIIEKIKYKSYEMASSLEAGYWNYDGGFDKEGSLLNHERCKGHIRSFTPKHYQVYEAEGIDNMLQQPGFEGDY